MSAPTPTPAGKKPDKNPKGLKNMKRHSEEKAARKEAHEEDALAHERATDKSRKLHAWWVGREARLKEIIDKSAKEIAAMEARREVLLQEGLNAERALAVDEVKFGADAAEGGKDAEIHAKYKAYLELETDELDL